MYSRLQKSGPSLQLRSWDHARKTLQKCFWVNDLSDPCHKIWDKVTSNMDLDSEADIPLLL